MIIFRIEKEIKLNKTSKLDKELRNEFLTT